MQAAIVGLSGPALSRDEASILRASPPAGVILFGRNIVDKAQLAALVAALRGVLPAGSVIAVDQEGGRVARLRPPHWRAHGPAAAIGSLYGRDRAAGRRAAYLTGVGIGLEAHETGFGMVCAPVLDLRVEGASEAIGDRAFDPDPAVVGTLGMAMAQGLLDAGVLPVAKHAPGHGRALLDSHHALPVVPAGAALEDDIAPFRACATLPCMMTAHLLYEGLDPARPATLSPTVIGDVIRGRIGFSGMLLSDDLAMKALDGGPGALAAAARAAGCDVALHCTGELAETEAVLGASGTLPAHAAAILARPRRQAVQLGMLPAVLDERARLLSC